MIFTFDFWQILRRVPILELFENSLWNGWVCVCVCVSKCEKNSTEWALRTVFRGTKNHCHKTLVDAWLTFKIYIPTEQIFFTKLKRHCCFFPEKKSNPEEGLQRRAWMVVGPKKHPRRIYIYWYVGGNLYNVRSQFCHFPPTDGNVVVIFSYWIKNLPWEISLYVLLLAFSKPYHRVLLSLNWMITHQQN